MCPTGMPRLLQTLGGAPHCRPAIILEAALQDALWSKDFEVRRPRLSAIRILRGRSINHRSPNPGRGLKFSHSGIKRNRGIRLRKYTGRLRCSDFRARCSQGIHRNIAPRLKCPCPDSDPAASTEAVEAALTEAVTEVVIDKSQSLADILKFFLGSKPPLDRLAARRPGATRPEMKRFKALRAAADQFPRFVSLMAVSQAAAG
jgi:hypothetical protein